MQTFEMISLVEHFSLNSCRYETDMNFISLLKETIITILNQLISKEIQYKLFLLVLVTILKELFGSPACAFQIKPTSPNQRPEIQLIVLTRDSTEGPYQPHIQIQIFKPSHLWLH